ncbi:type III secretion system chaperone [Roseiconus lacunae]|nr:type III secretion system chaperone [Roseiconus lacunae]
MTTESIETELERLSGAKLNREDANAVLGSLGEIVGISDLAFDDSGVVELVIDDDIELSLIHLADLPGVIAAVCMPEGIEQRSDILCRLLQTNLSWPATQGGCFVYIPNRIALCRLVPVTSCDATELDHNLASFVTLAAQWREELEDQMTNGSASIRIETAPPETKSDERLRV